MGLMGKFCRAKLPDPPTLGVGYLVKKHGEMFRNTTAKVYLNWHMGINSIYVTTELIFTDNFKQIFPTLNVKVRM